MGSDGWVSGLAGPKRGLARQAELGPILMELAALGQKGLPVNEPTRTYQLRSLPGDHSAPHLVCLLHVGIILIDRCWLVYADADLGIKRKIPGSR